MSTMRVWPSGHLIDPLSPDPQLIVIDDIAHHLAGIYRYGGGSRLTVAQHCCEIVHYVLWQSADEDLELAFDCLMHDAAEYLLGDMIRPLKHGEFGAAYLSAEMKLEAVLRQKYGYGQHRFASAVKDYDCAMCATEQRDLFGATKPDLLIDNHPALPGVTIHPWTPEHAESEFLRLFYLLNQATDKRTLDGVTA